MLLWKPVLMSFVKVIDQLAHLMYLEFGKIPEIQLNVRARLWSNSNKPVFEELLMRLKVLSFIAMVSDYTSLEILVSTIQSENSNDKLFSVPLESKIHNFTVSTIMKWMSEFFRGDSEYKTKIELLLGTSQIPPSQFPPPVFDVAKTVSNPIPVLEFENSNVKQFMKRIHYYIDMTKNMLSFQSNNRSYQDWKNQPPEIAQDDKLLDLTQINIYELVTQICDRIRESIGSQNSAESYSNFMTLQSLYIILRSNESMQLSTNSLLRELANLIVAIASTDITGILLFGFNQFIKYLQVNNYTSDTTLFNNIFFGSNNVIFDKLLDCIDLKNIPKAQRVYNDFAWRQDKITSSLANVVKSSTDVHHNSESHQFSIYTRNSKILLSTIDILKHVDNHEYFYRNEHPTTYVDLWNYFETYIRYIKSWDISSAIFHKRINLGTMVKTILSICSLDIPKLVGSDLLEQSNSYSNIKLIQIHSVLIEFVFETLLFLSEIYRRGVNNLMTYQSSFFEASFDVIFKAVNNWTVSLIKFIMNVWLNFEWIKYYERSDQLKKMIRLLTAIQSLLESKNSFPRSLVSENEIVIQYLELSSKRITRKLSQPYTHLSNFEIADNRQNILSVRDGVNCLRKLCIYNQNDVFYNLEYDYIQDASYVLTYWIDQLNAHNYDESGPKKTIISQLANWNSMIYYFPRSACYVYAHSPTQGNSKYTNSFKAFKKIVEDAVFANPQYYLLFHQAMLIYTDLEKTEQEPSSREYKNCLHLWRNLDLIIGMKFLNRDHDYYSTLHMLSLQFLNYASRDSLLFLSSEILQALRTYTNDKVEEFLVSISTKWPSLTHAIVWMAEVETKVTKDKKGRKVPLERDDTLPDTCRRIIQKILAKVRKHEKLFFESESNFFESIMSISSILKPKMPKDEKRRIIKEHLVEINKSIPKGIYLPTNPSWIVQSIVETSGAPMQSAAKWPILVAFRVTENNKPKDIENDNNEESPPNIQISSLENKQNNYDNSKNIKFANDSAIGIFGRQSENGDLEDRIFASHQNVMKDSFKNSVSMKQTVSLSKGFVTPHSFMMKYQNNRAQTLFDNSRMRLSMRPKSMFTSLAKSEKQETKENQAQKDDLKVVAWIFKTFDDVRQDILALQLIKLFQDIFKVYELDLHLVNNSNTIILLCVSKKKIQVQAELG